MRLEVLVEIACVGSEGDDAMKDEKMAELGRRAVACEGWRWMPGMRCTHRWTGGIRILARPNGESSEKYVVVPDEQNKRAVSCFVIAESGTMVEFPEAGSAYQFIPDFTDPATVGCLLYLVREAWAPFFGDDSAPSSRQVPSGKWGVSGIVDDCSTTIVLPTRDTEAEALVAALKSAPK